MSLIIKKRIWLFILLLSSSFISLYGMRKENSFANIESYKREHKDKYDYSEGGSYTILRFNSSGRVVGDFQVDDSVILSSEEVENIFEKGVDGQRPMFKGYKWEDIVKTYDRKNKLIIPRELPEPIPLWQQCLNIFNMFSNNPMVRKYVQAEIIPKLIILLQDFLMENREKSKLEKQLYLEVQKGERLKKKSQELKEKLKKGSKYFKQIFLLHSYLSSM